MGGGEEVLGGHSCSQALTILRGVRVWEGGWREGWGTVGNLINTSLLPPPPQA